MTIRPVETKDLERVREMQCAFLDAEDMDSFKRRVELDPGLYLAAWDGGKLAGICYGKLKTPPGTAVLNGVCADLNEGYGRKGVGSALLRAFEKALRERGCKAYDAGSAPDPKVEAFYLKNGFHAVQLVAKSGDGKETTRVEVENYEQGLRKRKELHEKFGPGEVIFIFKKDIA